MKKIVLLSFFALSFLSCDDYVDVNNDPTKLPFNQVGSSEILPAAQLGAYRVQSTTMNQLGNVFMNSWGANITAFTGGYAREFQLTVDNAFYSGIFENTFLSCKNFQEIIKRSTPDHKNDNYEAVARILKVYYLQYLVDLYGDLPYTEAFLDIENISPKYNDDQFIYRQLLNELDIARDLIDDANVNAEDISSYDIMLQGNMSDWKAFANTVELKMLLRMSNNTGAVAAYRDSRLTSLEASSPTFITNDVKINPGFSTATTDQMNPFNAAFTYDAAGVATQNWTFVCMTGHAYKFLRSYAPSNGTAIDASLPAPYNSVTYPGVSDPRAARKYRGTLRGVTQGNTVVDVPSSGTPARNGYGLFNPYLTKSEPIAFISELQEMATNDGFVMTGSEANLILAEAAVRYGSILTSISGQEVTFFNTAIQQSFAYNGISSSLGSYMTSIATKPQINLAASTTMDEKICAIMSQKWIALLGIHGIESFIDYNRTGYPVTPLAMTATQSRKPRRLIYPVSEYVANSANVPNITPANIFATTDNSHPFWMLGDPALGN